MNDLERAKLISENKDLSKEQRSVGVMAAVMGLKNDTVIKSMVTVADAEITKKATPAKKPRRPRGMDKTDSVLYDMLTENTGCAMMDSGGDDGRHWQRNAGRDFRDDEPYTYYVDKNFGKSDGNEYVNITKSLFYHLRDNCTYNDEETKKFWKWCKKNNAEKFHYGSAEQYLEDVYFADRDVSYHTGLTYNGEDCLSQGFQYTIYQGMIFLQIHGGADIRGGYTDVRVFDCEETVELASDCGMECGCGHLYSDDAGYHWYDSFEADAHDNYDNGLPRCWVIDEEASSFDTAGGSSLEYEKLLKCKECGESVKATY